MENNKIIVSEKSELAPLKPPKKSKKILLILLSIIAILFISIYAVLSTNIIFKIAPEKLLPASYAKTYMSLNNESKSFLNDYNSYKNNSDIKQINNYTLNIFDSTFEITNYHDLSKGKLILSDSTKIDFYIDGDSLIFSVNDSEFYEINDLLKLFLIADNNNSSSLSLVSFKSDNIETDASTTINDYLFKDNEVTFYDEYTEIVKEYDKDEFLTLCNYIGDNLNNDLLSFVIDTSAKFLTFRCDTVYVTYKLDNQGKLKNVIREVTITTNNDSDRYVQLKSNDKKHLLDEFEINFKLFLSEHSYKIKTNLSEYKDTLYISLNNDTFDVTINSSKNEIVFNLGKDAFLKLSNNNSLPTLPDEIYKISQKPFKFLLDIFNSDISKGPSYYENDDINTDNKGEDL